ncbi:HAD hydrolase-like protein [Actinopolymorpha alba]|uniref:HAD hydrolase-like protein n=1 Tax=Actinopolymorpha alba TaxID=533267 RepID=UPI00192BA230
MRISKFRYSGSPEPYLTGLKRLGATEEETLVVEDSSRGLNSAVAAGIDCVIVYNDLQKHRTFHRLAIESKL